MDRQSVTSGRGVQRVTRPTVDDQNSPLWRATHQPIRLRFQQIVSSLAASPLVGGVVS
jgi:hypothetical protein